MRVQLPDLSTIHFTNNIASLYSLRSFISSLSETEVHQFNSFVDELSVRFPLHPPQSEDKVVEKLMPLLRKAGWNPKDRRSSFIPRTTHKPDIWLNEQIAYVEAADLKASGWKANWKAHLKKTVLYSRHSKAQTAICTDGRRWFIVCNRDGTPKYAIIDLKKFSKGNPQYRAFAALLWRNGPLYEKSKLVQLNHATLISKNLFKKHVLASIGQLEDDYKEYYGLIASCAYAHYNDSSFIDTTKLLDCIHLLMNDHHDAAISLLSEFVGDLVSMDLPGISTIAARVRKLIGKNKSTDIVILKSLLLDEVDRPLSWEAFDSDDLSQVYETLLASERKKYGIFATPRDLCYEIVTDQLSYHEYTSHRHLGLIDPCCGSGSFLDQAVRRISAELSPAIRAKKDTFKLRKLTFLGQDIKDLAVAITLVNVYVACIKYLWHLDDIQIDIYISTGSTLDRRSILFRRASSKSPDYTFVFGNPPFVRSRSKKLGGVTKQGNMLFDVTDKVLELCSPGQLAFILPAHVIGAHATEGLDQIIAAHKMRLRYLWHLPEIKLFRGTSERRHVVAAWLPDKRPKAKLLVFVPPDDDRANNITSSIRSSRRLKSLQFEIPQTALSDTQLFANQYIPEEAKDALNMLQPLAAFKELRLLTMVQGIQESHPYVPNISTKKEKDRYEKIIKKNGFAPGSPMFVLSRADIKKMKRLVRRDFTQTELRHLRLHAKSLPKDPCLRYPRSKKKVIFANKELGALSQAKFEKTCPHFCAWLKPYYPLLMADIDRKSQQLKWWQLQRSRDPRPRAKTRTGVDFSDTKLLAAQFLSTDLWCWVDHSGHVAAGSSFNVVSIFPGQATYKELRDNWANLLVAWLNSYLIREVWLKLLCKCRVRGVGGEVGVKQLAAIPVPYELICRTDQKKIEKHVSNLAEIADRCMKAISIQDLIEIDKAAWKLLEACVNKKIGSPMTRKEGAIELRPVA